MKLPSIKTQLIIFLIAFAFFLSIKDRDVAFLFTTSVALLSALAVDSLIIYLREKRLLISESSIISGLIIGFVLSSDQPWWIFLLASLLAIGSKHLIRTSKNHLFNPAAFGIFLVTLFGVYAQWKGTYAWYILIPAGFYFAYKIRKLEVVMGYGLASLVLFGFQAFMQKLPLSNIFGYLSYFYIFVMLIEPKTTPIKSLGKLIFGIGASVLIFIFTEAAVKFDAELCALLVLNPFVSILNKLPERRLI